MLRIILIAPLALLAVACGKSPDVVKRVDVAVEFQQTEEPASSGNLAQIITTETKCISLTTDRDKGAGIASGFSGAKASGTINVPEGMNKFTLSSYTGKVDTTNPALCTGTLHEQFNVNANIVAGEKNTLVLHPLRASWSQSNGQPFSPHSLTSTHPTINPFAVEFDSIDFEQDYDPNSRVAVPNSYDAHISYDSASVTLPTGSNVMLPQFSASTNIDSLDYRNFYEKILFDTEQYSGLYSLCSPYPGLLGSRDRAGCNLRVKAVPDVARAKGDLSDGGLTLVSNLGVYSVESGISLLSIGFDPCTYLTHESPLGVKSCSYTILDSNGADITSEVRDKFKSTVKSGTLSDEMNIHFVEVKVYNRLSTKAQSNFRLATSEKGAPSPSLGPSDSMYSFADPYEGFRGKTSTILPASGADSVCYKNVDLLITSVTSNPLSPNYGKKTFDPQIAKATNLFVDICGKKTSTVLTPSPNNIGITQTGVKAIDLAPGTVKSEGTLGYTKKTQPSATVVRDKGVFFHLVGVDYYDATFNSPNDALAKIGVDVNGLSFLGRPTNAPASSPLGNLKQHAVDSYAYDIANAKNTISTASAVRFWIYDYLDLYTADASESGVVVTRP